MRRVLPALIVVGLIAVAAVFAWRSLRPGPRAVAYDLAERLPYAARVSAREVILFGWPDAEPRQMLRLGKKETGRLLDGVLHDGFPEPQP